jgi:hypothetical protein
VEREKVGRENVRMSFANLNKRLPGMEPDLLMGLLGELNSFHLVYVTATPGVRLVNYANCPIELPPIGFRFATYILGQKCGR